MSSTKTKIFLGFLMLVVLTASVYILLPDKVRIDVAETRTQYRVYEDGSWILAGTEYTKLYDGTSLMRAKDRVVNYTLDGDNKSTIYRYAFFKDNITAIDIYKFDGSKPEVELVPISHEIRILNGVGKIFQYEVNDILYTGETKIIESPFSFGHKMKVEWQDGAYYSKVFQQKVASDKLIIKYRPTSSDESYLVRLFDPDIDLNLSYGPPGTTLFRFATCGSNIINESAFPQNQTSTYGIDKVCNNGTETGDVQVILSSDLNAGWTWYASNESGFVPENYLSTFNNSLSEENITFSGDENYTRWLSVPEGASVTSAVMNLSGNKAIKWQSNTIIKNGLWKTINSQNILKSKF